MITAGSPAARARRTLPAAAVLLFIAGLTIAAAWSATETARAADHVRRSSRALVQLAQLRVALMEARVMSGDLGTVSRRRARNAVKAMDKLPPIEPADQGAIDRLRALVDERTRTVPPGRAAAIDREIERLALEREVVESARLAEATRRVRTTGLQTMFLISAIGILAAGAAAFAFRPIR